MGSLSKFSISMPFTLLPSQTRTLNNPPDARKTNIYSSILSLHPDYFCTSLGFYSNSNNLFYKVII